MVLTEILRILFNKQMAKTLSLGLETVRSCEQSHEHKVLIQLILTEQNSHEESQYLQYLEPPRQCLGNSQQLTWSRELKEQCSSSWEGGEQKQWSVGTLKWKSRSLSLYKLSILPKLLHEPQASLRPCNYSMCMEVQ